MHCEYRITSGIQNYSAAEKHEFLSKLNSFQKDIFLHFKASVFESTRLWNILSSPHPS